MYRHSIKFFIESFFSQFRLSFLSSSFNSWAHSCAQGQDIFMSDRDFIFEKSCGIILTVLEGFLIFCWVRIFLWELVIKFVGFDEFSFLFSFHKLFEWYFHHFYHIFLLSFLLLLFLFLNNLHNLIPSATILHQIATKLYDSIQEIEHLM